MYKYIPIIIAISLTAVMLANADTPKNATQLYEAATHELDAKHMDSAIQLYLKADSAFRAEGLENTPEYALALHTTGRAYMMTGDIPHGREYTKQAVELREKLFGKANEQYLSSLNNYAFSFLLENDLDEALKYQTQVVDLCAKLDKQNPDEGMYMINLGRILYDLGDEDKAVETVEAALSKVEKFGDDYQFAITFLGKVYMDRDDNANVNRIMGLLKEFNENELKKDCNDPECHLERAQYYMSTGRPSDAKDEFMAVFALPLTDEQMAEAYRTYAMFLDSQDDYVQAADYYILAANAYEAAHGKCEESTYLLRQAAQYYFFGKEFDKAIETHTKVIEDVDKYGYSESLKGAAIQGLGNAYSSKQDHPQAIVAYKRWIRHLENNGQQNDADYAKAYERLASAEKSNGDYDASIADYGTAIELYQKLGMHAEAEQTDIELKLCMSKAHQEPSEFEENTLAQQQRNDMIRETLNKSINLLEQSGDYIGNLSKAQNLATIAGAYDKLGEYEKAIDYYEQYIALLRPAIAEDFLLKNAKERELTWRQELDNISQMNEMMIRLPQDSLDLYTSLSRLIYEGQLLAKGILLSSNIEFEKVMSRYGTPEMKDQYEKVKDSLLEIARMRQEHRPTQEILELTRSTDALQLALAREAASKGLFTDFIKYTCSDVVDALGPDEAAIEFVTLDSEFIHDNDLIVAVLVSKEIPLGMTIPVATVGMIKTIIEDPNKFASDDYTAAVWGYIIPLVLDKKKIYFAPDGVLNNIGIEYLTVEGTPISDLIEMSRLSSTREICRKHQNNPLLYAALFGDIDYIGDGALASDKRKLAKRASDGVNFSNLENTGREISEITQILKKNTKKSKILPYTGVKASKAEFLSQDQLPINLMHIATHGKYIDEKAIADGDAMDRSILAFAGANLFDNYKDNDGIVSAAEISQMGLRDCNLVVLSACESGLGKLGDDGVFGLQRGFKNAGVQTLLVSLNEVADQATADMMISFYRNLMAGDSSMLEAFKTAQSEIRAKYPNDDTWASFIMIDAFN